ncbi:MAG TPA: hypothetical protein VHI13_01175 [Candidatus Kapabacteria bacterium]|nr:hypothetical protein [Candidatus Kapabacteria bacterium]
MKRSPAFAAVLLVALASVQVHAQTAMPASSKATRIEYTASYAAMNVTTRAVLTDGQRSTPLVFTETPASLAMKYPYMQTYTTKAVTVYPGMRVTNEALSNVRVSTMPVDMRSPVVVSWRLSIELHDISGTFLQNAAIPIYCRTSVPFDTVITCSRQIDLAPYVGKSVYLEISVAPDLTGAMVDSRRVSVVDCTETQPLSSIK